METTTTLVEIERFRINQPRIYWTCPMSLVHSRQRAGSLDDVDYYQSSYHYYCELVRRLRPSATLPRVTKMCDNDWNQMSRAYDPSHLDKNYHHSHRLDLER